MTIREIWEIYQNSIIFTIVILLALSLFRFLLKKATKKTGILGDISVNRTRLMFKYINLLVTFIAIFLLLLVWGIDRTQISLVFSSIFAVVGVALFAIWSILSNITSGVIMFFSFPYKIGSKIRIHDKDAPIEAYIEDIRAFHLHLRTTEGELITYPNNLMLQKAVSVIDTERSLDEGKDAL